MGVLIIIGIILFFVIISNLSSSSKPKSSSSSAYSSYKTSNSYKTDTSYKSPYSSASSYSNLSGNRETSPSTSSSYSSNRIVSAPTFNADSSINFKTVEKNGVTNFYLYDYYPKNRYPEIDGEHHANRILVWNFKDGSSSKTVGSKISSALINKFGKSILSTKTLCIIPASTSYKTSNRYSSFCQIVSNNVGIKNGYNILSNSSDRETTHNDNNRNINHSSYIDFGDVRGKDIILFDDVITSGKSFNNVRATLLRNGARSVIGVFLAKTVSSSGYFL